VKQVRRASAQRSEGGTCFLIYAWGEGGKSRPGIIIQGQQRTNIYQVREKLKGKKRDTIEKLLFLAVVVRR